NELKQHLVSLRRELIDGARTDLLVNAVDELPLHVGRQYRLPENLPPGRHRTGELLEEMLDAAFAAAEVVEEHVAHDAPAQARPPGQRGVDVGGADHPVGDERVDLPRKGGLQTIGDMPGQLPVQSDWTFSQGRVEV